VFPDGELGPEDEGLARWFPEGAMATIQLHYVNTSETDSALREAWVNLYRRDESEVKQRLQTVFLVGDVLVNVQPNDTKITPLSFAPTITEPLRVFELAGHSHAHNERFSVWRTIGGERQELVYESYDWAEPIECIYNSVVQNPLPSPADFQDGGTSGLFYLQPGEGLDWECEVNNTTDAPLNFSNEAYTAEMCLLGGAYISETSGLMAGICGAGSCGFRVP
jgi:hypothetical protein